MSYSSDLEVFLYARFLFLILLTCRMQIENALDSTGGRLRRHELGQPPCGSPAMASRARHISLLLLWYTLS